jgi:tetratricopeptide (TPR) repeat protein
MAQQKYPRAYEAYQQAVYRDGRNPTFWCSIGVLYYQINQYRDALDAYSRAIRLNPNISEVWYDLGTLVSSDPLHTRCHHRLLTLRSMNRATIRLPMPWTLIKGPLSWIPPMSISRLVSNCCVTHPPLASRLRQAPHCLKTCIHRHTSLR